MTSSRSEVHRDLQLRAPVPDLSLQVVVDWIHAYYSRRDADLVDLASPQIEIHPRPDIAPATVYRGRAGVWQWLADTASSRLKVDTFSLAELSDSRVLASSDADGFDVTAIFAVSGAHVTQLTLHLAGVDEFVRRSVTAAEPEEWVSSHVPFVRLLADAAARASQRR